MRNPALHLVGIAAPPGGGGVFSSCRAEEELRHWLEQRLDALGIDPVASYSRFVISLLRCPDSALTPSPELLPKSKFSGAAAATAAHNLNNRARYHTKLPLHTKREPRRAVVKCLTSAADQKCGVETLVDELCTKLKDLEGINTKKEQNHPKTATNDEVIPFESLNPRDQALRYYAAFPALQTTAPKKLRQKQCKEQNLINNNKLTNNNQNNIKNYNNKKSISINSGKNKNKVRQKKNKLFLQQVAETQLRNKIEDFEVLKKMQEQEKEQELALDQLRLAQLEAKFDESLEALWKNESNMSQTMDSIWAAPSFSIPSVTLWPSEITDVSFSAIASEKTLQCQETLIDDSPLIPLDVDLFDIDDYDDETDNKIKPTYDNVSWSDSVGDSPFCWGGRQNVAELSGIPCTASCYPECNVNCIKVNKESTPKKSESNNQEQEEDLLTSPRTHFRPIKEDGWADGTTFPINNALETVAFKRSESGNLLYLPDGDIPYMEYKERLFKPIAVDAKLTLKFRVQQCDKGVQTDSVRSPTKRRLLSDHEDLFNVRMVENSSFNLAEEGWDQPIMPIRNERKRRHSSSLKSQPLAVLRPLTL